MKDIYTPFSNYNEHNLKNRKEAASKEVHLWGDESEKFLTYRKEWKKAAQEDYLPKNPLHLDIEVSDACNLKCQYCAHGLGTVGKVGFIKPELVEKLLLQAVDLEICSIKFNWRGEATLNPRLPDYIRRAKELGIMEVQINTNGLPKDNKMLIQCAEAGLDRVIFSVDGFSKESYEEARRGGNYDRLMSNINDFLQWKNLNKLVKPFVRIQMVRNNLNSMEVDDFVKYWQVRVDDVRISDVMDRGQGDGFSVKDSRTMGRRRCPQPFQRLVVGRDGRVSPCCADWNQQFIVGNVEDFSLQQLWSGSRMKNMREIQKDLRHNEVDICKNCYVKESFVWEK